MKNFNMLNLKKGKLVSKLAITRDVLFLIVLSLVMVIINDSFCHSLYIITKTHTHININECPRYSMEKVNLEID